VHTIRSQLKKRKIKVDIFSPRIALGLFSLEIQRGRTESSVPS